MKQLISRFKYKGFLTLGMLALFQAVGMAQDNPSVEINGNDVGSWFSHNWIWVTALVVLLLLLLIVSVGNSRSKRTTVVRKKDGTVTSTSVVEED